MKFFLISLWLLLPLSGMLMLAADYKRFNDSAAVELRACADLSRHLTNYAADLDLLAESLRFMDDLGRRDEWRRRWRRLTATEEREAAGITSGPLANAPYEHFPRTQSALLQARAKLLEMEAEGEAALRAREQLIKTRAGLDDLREQARDLAILSERYRSMWTYGIYLQLQERLGEAEERLREGQRACDQIEAESSDHLDRLNSLHGELKDTVAQAEQYRQEDGRVSYREALLARFNRFDLRSELRRLFATAPPGAAPPARP